MVQLTRPTLEALGVDGLRPSGVVELDNGHLLVLDAWRRMILELDGARRPVGWVRLDRDRHRQPEGIAVTPEGHLLIADEGGGGRARLTRYGPR